MRGKERVIYWYDNGRYLLLVRHRVYDKPPPHSTTPGLYLRGTLFEVQFDRQFMLALELGQGLKLNAIISYRLTPPPPPKKKKNLFSCFKDFKYIYFKSIINAL